MFQCNLADPGDIAAQLAANEEWTTHTIAQLQDEIAELSRTLQEREAVINQQNFDLQDTYRRYMSLASNQCERELNKIMDETEVSFLRNRIANATITREKVDTKSRNVSAQLEKVEQLAIDADRHGARLLQCLSQVDGNVNRKIEDLRQKRLERLKATTKQLLESRLHEAKMRNLEEIERKTDDLTQGNNKKQGTIDRLKNEWIGLNERISELMGAIELVQSHIIVALDQRPLPALNRENFDVASIFPVGRRVSSVFGNLVVLAPMHCLARRLATDRPKFFTPRLQSPRP
jgi:chromosome segregation ATPase